MLYLCQQQRSFRETKEFFNFEIRFENYIRVHQRKE